MSRPALNERDQGPGPDSRRSPPEIPGNAAATASSPTARDGQKIHGSAVKQGELLRRRSILILTPFVAANAPFLRLGGCTSAACRASPMSSDREISLKY
jgi:hypothetical protein